MTDRMILDSEQFNRAVGYFNESVRQFSQAVTDATYQVDRLVQTAKSLEETLQKINVDRLANQMKEYL